MIWQTFSSTRRGSDHGVRTETPQRWHRDIWTEAIWSSDLRPLVRLVAFCFSDHAHDRDVAWVSQDRLRERTGLARSTSVAAVQTLVRAGWLVEVEKARQHRSARYRLVIQPTGRRSSQPTDTRSAEIPADRETAPADRQTAPADRQTDPTAVPTRDPQPAPREPAVIIEPADRTPNSDDSVFDACAAAGATWTIGDFTAARRRLCAAFGGDTRAAGQADAALKAIAARPTPIRSLSAWLDNVERTPTGLTSLRVGTPKPPANPAGCDQCRNSPAGIGLTGDPDHPTRCHCKSPAHA